MKKIYKTVVPFLLTAFAAMPAQCMTFDVKSDFSRREVEVFGKASPNSVITMIIASDDDGDVVLTPENAQDKVFAGAQLKTDADGNFQKSFVFDNKFQNQ